MKQFSGALLVAGILAGCASPPQLPSWRADALLAALPPSCVAGVTSAPAVTETPILPGGLSVVRSGGKDVVLVAARSCVMTIDATTGAAELLPTRGDSIAPTMVDGTSGGVAFSSSLSGSVRAIDTTGAVMFNVSGLRYPLGVRLLPGGQALVAEYGTGRILRLGPSSESRVRLMAEGLEGPVGIAVADATKAYVTETRAGRVTSFGMDRFEKFTVASGLKRPEGIALLNDGRLVVAEVGLRRLIAIEPASGKIEVLADELPIGLTSAQGDSDPYTITDVTAAPDGALYVSADIHRTVLKVVPRPQPMQ
jgi:glucose/arabinose dehydrogenase